MIGEQVAFSSRIQLLVSKLGRSSKPSPRFLVVVSRYSFCLTQGVTNYCLDSEGRSYRGLGSATWNVPGKKDTFGYH